jgi:hypothetical protein
MSRLALCLIALSLLFITSPQLHAQDNKAPEGWTALFNGKDFTNFKVPDGDNGHWKIVNGVIDYDALSEAKGEKSLWSAKEYGDFVLRVDWRIKEAPYINPNVKYVLPDGSNARGVNGKELNLPLPDSDSGIYLRGNPRNQVNIWCWPIGSGEMYGWRTGKTDPSVKGAVTPRHQADKPIGEWNTFEITCQKDRVTIVLNGITVIDNAQLPGLEPKGALALQHHGAMRDGKWTSPPALVQFKNIYVRELDK